MKVLTEITKFIQLVSLLLLPRLQAQTSKVSSKVLDLICARATIISNTYPYTCIYISWI